MLVAGWLCGLSDLVEFVRAQPKESSYYLGGYGHMSLTIVRTATICALTAGVSEGALQMTLEDDRLARLLPQLEKRFELELEKVLHTDSHTYEMLGNLSDTDANSLADDCVTAVSVQIGYAENRLRVLRRLPWNLVGDDVEARLEKLKQGEPPTEEVGFKIYSMLHIGVPVDTIVAGIQLHGELPFTTRAVEQGHVLPSSLMQWHTKYTNAVMAARTVVAATKQLIVSPSDRLSRLGGALPQPHCFQLGSVPPKPV